MKKSKLYYPELDTLRVFAMLLVFMTHCYYMSLTQQTKVIYDSCFCFSGIGVEFFIVLSGFFAMLTYKKQPYSDYIFRKIKRLLPLHWVCMVIGLYLYGIHSERVPLATPISFFLLQSLVPFCGSPNLPSWTISTLMVLYIITPILAKHIEKISNTNHLLFIIFFLGAISFFVNYCFYDPKQEILFWFLYESPYFRIITFTIGMFLGRYVKCGGGGGKNGKDLYLKNTIYELICLAVFGILIIIWHKSPGYWYTIPIITLLLIITGKCGYISKLLRNKLTVSFSKYSFAFYLIHFPVLQFADFLLHEMAQVTPLFIFLTLGISLLISCFSSMMLYHYVEVTCSRINISFHN